MHIKHMIVMQNNKFSEFDIWHKTDLITHSTIQISIKEENARKKRTATKKYASMTPIVSSKRQCAQRVSLLHEP